MKRRHASGLLAVAVAFASACDLPPGAAPHPTHDLGGVVTFDASTHDAAREPSLVDLGGNQLELPDGGAGLARLWFNVTDGDTQLPTPSRVIFRPSPGAGFADSITSGTQDPLSPGGSTGAVVGPGVLGSPEGVLLVDGQGWVPVPPGTYGLFITRGPEYEAVETQVTVKAGETQTVNAELMRTVDTHNWLSADLHVHVNHSRDSKMPPDRRVISMASNNIEIMVTTDHNINSDLSGEIAGLGYGGDVIGSLVGNEFNFQQGHGGAYPVPYDATKPFGGATSWQDTCTPPIFGINCVDPATGFAQMKQQVPGQTVVTINHPYWPGADLGYFTNIHWGAGTSGGLGPLSVAGSFDAMEILIGSWVRADAINALTADWFYLLGQGYKVTGLGSSDTHKLNWIRAGYPRSWLRLPIDKPGDITGPLLSEAILKQRVIASTGPFITVTVDGAQIGDTVIPKTAGQAQVHVFADAPNWITVDTITLYVNGVAVQTFTVPAGARPVLDATWTQQLPTGQDAWVVAFATGQRPMPPDVVGEYANYNGYNFLPWAITNPVFIDGNGDGAWSPPATPMPPANGAMKPAYEPDTNRLRVPQDCEPVRSGQPQPAEPLQAPERELMPLLYP
jgi:hypothetical protein